MSSSTKFYPLLVLLIAFCTAAYAAADAPDADAPREAAEPTDDTQGNNASDDDDDDDGDDNAAHTDTPAFVQALAPRQAQSRAIHTLLGTNDAWTEHDTWLDLLAAHAENGADAWTEERCASAVDAARRAFENIGDVDLIKHPRVQRQAEVLLDAATHCEQEDYIELALRAVNRALPQMRGAPILPTFRDALVSLAAHPYVQKLRRTDTRLILPYIDALQHIKDSAALLRLCDVKLAADPPIGKDRLEQAKRRAEQSAPFRLPLDAPKDCRPIIDGERVRGKDVELRQGSYMIGCENDDARLRFYTATSPSIF